MADKVFYDNHVVDMTKLRVYAVKVVQKVPKKESVLKQQGYFSFFTEAVDTY